MASEVADTCNAEPGPGLKQKMLIGMILAVGVPLSVAWMVVSSIAILTVLGYAIGSPLAVFMHYVLDQQRVQVHSLEITVCEIEAAICFATCYGCFVFPW